MIVAFCFLQLTSTHPRAAIRRVVHLTIAIAFFYVQIVLRRFSQFLELDREIRHANIYIYICIYIYLFVTKQISRKFFAGKEQVALVPQLPPKGNILFTNHADPAFIEVSAAQRDCKTWPSLFLRSVAVRSICALAIPQRSSPVILSQISEPQTPIKTRAGSTDSSGCVSRFTSTPRPS
jgi:hypothetical protein